MSLGSPIDVKKGQTDIGRYRAVSATDWIAKKTNFPQQLTSIGGDLVDEMELPAVSMYEMWRLCLTSFAAGGWLSI